MNIKTYFQKYKKMYTKKRMIIAAVCCVFLIIFSCCFSSSKIGVVDMSRVYAQAEVFRSIHDEQQAIETEWREQGLAEREKLELADRTLSRKKSTMKRAKFEKEAAVLKEKILDFQNQQLAKLDLIRYRAAQITTQVEATMKPIIAQVAEDKDIEFVLSASNVLYHTKAVDITQEVIEQLDKAFKSGQLPVVQISLSEGE